jgi:hypothetical protein
MKKLLILLAFVLFAETSYALMEVNLYQELIVSKNENEKKLIRNYIGGVKDALTSANALLEIDKKQPLYCPPRNLALTTDNFIQLINDGLSELDKTKSKESLKEIKEGELTHYIAIRMQQVFPCKN